ncbi:MAG TPA: hypothetical protein V6D50_16835 [Chroococcales cyanobacterium]
MKDSTGFPSTIHYCHAGNDSTRIFFNFELEGSLLSAFGEFHLKSWREGAVIAVAIKVRTDLAAQTTTSQNNPSILEPWSLLLYRFYKDYGAA